MPQNRKESDSHREVDVPADKLWGAQTQRSLKHFSIGQDLVPREMITAYTVLKKGAALANYKGGRLEATPCNLIVKVCDEILSGQHDDMFPLHVWMSGSGTQFNMNVNEVISNRCCQLSGTFRTLAVSLYKICNDIRLMSCGPRAGFAELMIPENEPGSSIMPGKVNPTQVEALTMIAVRVMANDVAVGFGGASGYLEMNVYKPLIIFNITQSITILTDGCTNFRRYLVEGTEPNLKRIAE